MTKPMSVNIATYYGDTLRYSNQFGEGVGGYYSRKLGCPWYAHRDRGLRNRRIEKLEEYGTSVVLHGPIMGDVSKDTLTDQERDALSRFILRGLRSKELRNEGNG